MENLENQKIETLDYYVRQTLDNLPKWEYPKLEIKKNCRNVFVGSGNAANAGRILAREFGGAGFSVVDYQSFFKNCDDSDRDVYIINASGGKDGVKMAQWLTQNGRRPKLITSNPEPLAGKFLRVEDIFAFPAIKEPPTYNVSTYAAMLYGILKEDISGADERIKNLKVPDLRRYKFIFFLTDDKYEPAGRVAKRKVAESLAGLGADAGGHSNAAHGMLLQPNADRLIVCINCDYEGEGDWWRFDAGSYIEAILAVHYIVGKNQTTADLQNILRNYFENAKKQGWEFNKVW
jgi:hypothetical protein